MTHASVAGEIAATLYHVGVPRQEHGEFMAIIESYRSLVVGPAEVPAQEAAWSSP